MTRTILVVCIALLGALIAIGALTDPTTAHAVTFIHAQVPDGGCTAYAAYLATGHAPIELAEQFCPLA